MSKSVTEETHHYRDRNYLVLMAARLAQEAGYQVGVNTDSDYPESPVVYIELPSGQVSWHLSPTHFASLSKLLPKHERAWGRHTTGEKQLRICEYFLSPDFM